MADMLLMLENGFSVRLVTVLTTSTTTTNLLRHRKIDTRN